MTTGTLFRKRSGQRDELLVHLVRTKNKTKHLVQVIILSF